MVEKVFLEEATKEEFWYMNEPPSKRDLDLAPGMVEMYKKVKILPSHMTPAQMRKYCKPVIEKAGYEWKENIPLELDSFIDPDWTFPEPMCIELGKLIKKYFDLYGNDLPKDVFLKKMSEAKEIFNSFDYPWED